MARGFSTIEILIALAVMVVALSSIILLSFSAQSMLIGGQDNADLLHAAQVVLEREQAIARKDFNLVLPVATTSIGGVEVAAAVSRPEFDPYTSKLITAIAISTTSLPRRSVELRALVSNFNNARAADTCSSVLEGDWKHPSIANYSLSSSDLLASVPFGHSLSATNPIPALDAYKGVLFVAVATTSGKTNDSVFLFDHIDGTQKPRYLSSIDTNAASIDGILALRAIEGYAFLMSNHDANFKTCSPGASCAQIQVLETSLPSAPRIIANYEIPTTTPAFVTGSGGQALGKSIFYKDGYLYVGLSKTATGPEFNIIDAHDPEHLTWVGGYQIGAQINAILIRNHFAYLATDDNARELVILDITDPAHPTPVSGGVFNPPGNLNWGNGKSLFAIGDALLLGRTYGNGAKELYELSIAHSALGTPEPSAALLVGATVAGIYLRSGLVFFITATTKLFEIFDAASGTSFEPYAPNLQLPGIGAALECEGNTFFVASNAGANGIISIINAGI